LKSGQAINSLSGVFGGMASSTSVPPAGSPRNVTVEEVLLAVGEQGGHDHLAFSSTMNKAVVVFLKEVSLVYQLIESGVFLRDVFMQVSPLSVPSTRITVFRRLYPTSSGGLVNYPAALGCKDPKLKRAAVSEAAGVHVPGLAHTNTGGVVQSEAR